MLFLSACVTLEDQPQDQPFITSLSTDKGGNTGLVTVETNGGRLDSNAVVSLVRSGCEDINAKNVYGSTDGKTLSATFNLLEKEPGEWTFIVTNPDGQSATAPSSFSIKDGGESELWTEIVEAEKVQIGITAQHILHYGNHGDVDMPIPFLLVSSSPEVPMCCNQNQEFKDGPLKMLGIGSSGYPDILGPNSSYSIPIYLMSQDNETDIDFRVFNITSDPVYEVPILASFQDAFCPTPGITLDFTRVFPHDSIRYSYLGSLGYGWAHNYDIHLEELSDGTITLLRGNSYSRFFLNDGGGTYTALKDYSILTHNPDDTFQLKEKDDTIYSFRTNLKLDYIEDINGNRISVIYDSKDRLIELQHSCGDSFDFEYNEQGRISQLIDHIDRTTEYQYDKTGELLINVITPDGRVTNFDYTSNGENYGLTSITYPDNIKYFFEYDVNNRLSKVYFTGEEELVQFFYNIFGKMTYITDVEENVNTICVDDFNQIICSENPLGATVYYEYDGDFNVIRVIDPLGNNYDFSYDEHGNIVSIINPLNHEIKMGYNPSFNKLIWLRDGKGNEIIFDYDDYGNLVEITYQDSSSELLDYHSMGNIISEKSRKGDSINYNYNSRGQIIRKDYPDGSWIAYEYDNAGNMISAIDESGTIEMKYNAGDLLTSVTYPTGHFFNYGYDDMGRLIQRLDQDGNALNYEYDTANRLVRISDESDSDIVRYEYDTVGRLSKKSLSNGAYTIYEYDTASQISQLINYNTYGEVLSHFFYNYDLAGNPVTMNTLEGTYSYEYDDIGQLIKVIYPDGKNVGYSYDAAGNRLTVVDNEKTTTYSTNNMNQYTCVGNVSYFYDANGNLISKTDDGQTTTYQYNFENRITKVISPEGTWEYTYDALGNRVGMIHNDIEHRYLVDPMGFGDVVAEYDGNGSLIARYVHGLGLISQIDASGSPYFYHFNPTGHTINITDKDGYVVNRYRFSPFGIYLEKEENIPNPFRYVGEFGVMDDGNDLNYMRMRYYLPELGRFSSEDPLMILGKNRYDYVGNEPVTFIDPCGLLNVNVRSVLWNVGWSIHAIGTAVSYGWILSLVGIGVGGILMFNPATISLGVGIIYYSMSVFDKLNTWNQAPLQDFGKLLQEDATNLEIETVSFPTLSELFRLPADITSWLMGIEKCQLCGSTGKCVTCGGSGKCYLCGGDGICIICSGKVERKIPKWGGGYTVITCGCGNGKCNLCRGTGNCSICWGTGKCPLCKSTSPGG
jgi:RHS repeat-associated protein